VILPLLLYFVNPSLDGLGNWIDNLQNATRIIWSHSMITTNDIESLQREILFRYVNENQDVLTIARDTRQSPETIATVIANHARAYYGIMSRNPDAMKGDALLKLKSLYETMDRYLRDSIAKGQVETAKFAKADDGEPSISRKVTKQQSDPVRTCRMLFDIINKYVDISTTDNGFRMPVRDGTMRVVPGGGIEPGELRSTLQLINQHLSDN
jgi:hypothetical protein